MLVRDFKVTDPGEQPTSSDSDDADSGDSDEEEEEEPELWRKVDDEAQEALLQLDAPARLENISLLLEDAETAASFIRADHKELSLCEPANPQAHAVASMLCASPCLVSVPDCPCVALSLA